MLSRLFPPCMLVRSIPRLHRTFYSKPGHLDTLDARGQVLSQEIDIWVGDPHEAYIVIPTEVGHAIEKAILPDKLSNDKYPMVWNHAKRLFTCSKLYPLSHTRRDTVADLRARNYVDAAPWLKLSAPQDLHKEGSGAASPATLYRLPAVYSIVLDGTFDSRYSHVHIRRH